MRSGYVAAFFILMYTAGQVAFGWQQVRNIGDVARFDADVAKAGIKEMRLKLTETVKTTYSDWHYVYSALRINKINKSLLREFRDIAEVKYATGTASKQDVLHAEVEYALLEHQDIVLERRRQALQVIFNILLQRQPDQTIPPPDNFPKLLPLPAVERLRTSALEAHPELHAIDARILASRSRMNLAQLEYYPDVKLSTAYNSLWNQNKKRFNVGIGINIPIQGKRRASEDEAEAKLKQLELERQAKESQILGEVQRIYNRIIESKHTLKLYSKRLIPLAQENIEVARTDYQVDRGSFLDLINAEKNLMQVKLQSERALADYHSHFAMLEHAVGGADALLSLEGIKQ